MTQKAELAALLDGKLAAVEAELAELETRRLSLFQKKEFILSLKEEWGGERKTAVNDRPKAPARAEAGSNIEKIMEALRDGPLTADALAERTGLTVKQVKAASHNHSKRIERVKPDDWSSPLRLTPAGRSAIQ